MYVLTPTGGRDVSLHRLDMFMKAQTFQDFTWVVLDDCAERSRKPNRCDIHICPEWIWQGQNTQAQSMIRLLQEVPEGETVVICEDDDFYSVDHLEMMNYYLIDNDCVGQRDFVYFNTQNNTFREFNHENHSTMCATGFKSHLIEHMIDICTRYKANLDVYFWRMGDFKKYLMAEQTCVGIKGQPGRAGIGIGHHMIGKPGKLSDFIGENERFYNCGERSKPNEKRP
jgi:hypothetical protein